MNRVSVSLLVSCCMLLVVSTAFQRAGAETPNSAFVYQTSEDGVDLEYRVSATRLLSSQRLEVNLKVSAPDGVHFSSLRVPHQVFADFEPLGEATFSETALWRDQKIHWQKTAHYTLLPRGVGTFHLAGLRIAYSAQQGRGEQYLSIEPLEIVVESVLESTGDSTSDSTPASGQPQGLRGLIKPPILLWPLFVGIPLLLCVLWCTILFVKRHAAVPTAPPKTKRDYREEALQELQALEARGMPQDGQSPSYQAQVQHFHAELSRILRFYLEKCLDFEVEAKTTEEFLQSIAQESSADNRFDPQQKEMLASFMLLAERVIFSCFQPQSSDTAAAFDRIRLFIAYQEAPEQEHKEESHGI